MEMREIEVFLAVAEERHFGRAAQRLHLTTGTVSQTVRTLERRVGAPLFERTSRHVALTQVGTDFLASIRPAYEQLQGALADARKTTTRLRYRDVVRVAFANTLPPDLAPRTVKGFETEVPGSQVIQTVLPAATFLRWFENAHFDVDVFISWLPDPDPAISPCPVPDWVETGPVLFRAPVTAAMSIRHPLAGRTSIDIEELADYDILRPWGFAGFADRWSPPLSPGGRPMRRVTQIRLTFLEDFADLLGAGALVHLSALRPEQYQTVSPTLTTVPVTGLPPLACIPMWAKGNENPLIITFAEAAAEAYRDTD
jgi:DNA-binding transcriptional LysR family regulator